MLAARAYAGETEFALEDISVPEIAAGEALVHVRASGLAPGIPILWAAGMIKLLPATLGHEIAGEVAEVGPGVDAFAPGDRVRVHPNLTCGRCARCLNDEEQMCSACSMIGFAVFGPDAMPLFERYHDGGLAEYVRVPASLLDPLPENIPFDVAAKIHDIAGVNRSITVAGVDVGDTLVLTSGTGALGGVTVRLAEHRGLARVVVVGRSRERLEQIKELAPRIVEVVALDELGDGWQQSDAVSDAIRELAPDGADAVIDYTPEGPLPWHAARAMRVGGTLVIRAARRGAAELPMLELMHSCWQLVGTRNGTRRDAIAVTRLLASGHLEAADLFTHRLPLEQVNDGLAAMRDRSSKTWFVGIDVA